MSGKVAIVTGATGGIGRGVALRLAVDGMTVVVNGRDESRAGPVLAEIADLGGTAQFVAGDVRSRSDMDAVVAAAVDRFGGVDVVVPSAGGDDDAARSTDVRGPFGDIDLAQVTAFVAQAVASKLNVVQAAVPAMRERGGGSVVFVTSEGGRTPTPGQTAIAAFSGGLIMASKVLSTELARDQIRVNCVCVTVVRDSPSWTAAFENEGAVGDRHRRQYEKIIERSPLGVASPTDIGDVVAFLASDRSHYLTGLVASPTGGLTIH
ncbi:SDR family NAD(P)-dependent oxidoreductase [Pseudonocardia endophytica]|uniref:3-oxoacyl-[acyl-carrier protein] reductase n=1 Tax=Pseudonocardia endophytica TaxID=401976 RepID=A0A4R1HXC4_PSEEN|nr:SDR family NAD(P)-dependent oxidoreductase [Pseudonocardia endophytica]TCK25755.1 3-oxoacyl-[acyl-carrier protein] reductase [Pseudonocardia endophytica]